MSQMIELPDESVALLRRQASDHGLSVESWIEALALEKAQENDLPSGHQKAHAAVAKILEIQKRVKPDPEGWRIRDYIDHGRP